MFAKVIIDLSLDKAFDYAVPPHLSGRVLPGSRVRVPFGKSFRSGYVLTLMEASEYPQVKAIADLADHDIQISQKLLQLGHWMADYYCCAQEQAIRTLLPGAVRNGKVTHKMQKVYSIADGARAEQFIAAMSAKKSAAKRVAVLKELLQNASQSAPELENSAGVGASVLKTLLKDGLLKEEKAIVRRDIFGGRQAVRSFPLTPTPEQQKALEVIRQVMADSSACHTILLHGVTNSGKTEVYLQSIAMALEAGREAIVLVPEIALTPQTVRRFRSRFGDEISVLHSRLSDGERFDEWMRINQSQVKIVVGARSALFAPFRNLGLIIVDEEHESSYKQSEAPRYHARDVAVMRGKLEHAVVILGSATPSAESYFNALNGKYKLIEMRAKVDDKLQPRIKVIDQRLAMREDGKSTFFSPALVESIQDRLARGEQSILFLNRRGYARVMTCELCGFEARCPDCAVSYTYSKQRQTLSCHLCGNCIPAPTVCPSCQSPEIRFSGVGTEKIENVAMSIFKGARIARMDSDSMRSAESYEEVLNRFKRGDVDILIGTQMIAKGLHFPNVTLVGIVNADQGLAMPDFRAPERTFQLITQVAGRAGRGDVRGEVLLQTYNPSNETIQYAVNYDFAGFYKFDMEVRQFLNYPPFGHLMAVHFKCEDESACLHYAERFKQELMPFVHGDIKLAGPSPAPIERIKNKFRYLLVIRGQRLKNLRSRIRELLFLSKIPKEIDVYVDVDAQALL